MSYVKASGSTVEKYPYSIGLLRKDNPSTSFPRRMPDEQLASWNVYPVTVVEDPLHNPETQKIETATQPTFVNGAWILSKSVVDLTQEELDNRLTNKRAGMTCTPRQAKQALRQSGLYNQVKQYINTLQGDAKDEAEIEWNDATEFQRASGFLISMATALGLTEQQVDDLFDLAATL